MSRLDIKKLYLEMKGVDDYKKLSTEQKGFVNELLYQASIMRDLCIPLSRREIISLIENCKTEIQIGRALRDKKIAQEVKEMRKYEYRVSAFWKAQKKKKKYYYLGQTC